MKKYISKLKGRLNHTRNDFNGMKHLPKKIKFYTGLDLKRFNWLFNSTKHLIKKCSKLLSLKDHLLVIMMRLRRGIPNKDLAYRFNISESTISKIFRKSIPAMANHLKSLIKWPQREALRRELPRSFRRYRNCVSIIDCTEIFIERPFNLQARAQTWSSYKNNNTIKYLISITPFGTVSFLSNGWGGRASDKEITINSGYLDHLEYGDLVLADRGFTITEEVATRGAVLQMPAFTKGKSQLSQKEVDTSRKLANVRIHVERVIGRLRKFEILNRTIPTTQVDLLDDIMVVLCGIVNFCKSVVAR